MNFDQCRHYCLGRFWQLLKQPARALDAYGDSLHHGPRPAKVLRHMAYLHASQERYAQAESLFNEVVQLEPGDAHTHFNLGYVRDKLNRHDEAIVAFTQAVALNPALDRAWYGMGLAFATLGRHAEAADAFGKAAELQPMSAPVWLQLGMACHHARNPERVREVILHLNRFDPVMARQLIRDTGASDMAHLVKDLAV
jgi:tetratricopeptide (TPR) repeat protein